MRGGEGEGQRRGKTENLKYIFFYQILFSLLFLPISVAFHDFIE